MKPKTKFQKRIIKKYVPKPSKGLVKWAKGTMSKTYSIAWSYINCHECGHRWKSSTKLDHLLDYTCPECGEELSFLAKHVYCLENVICSYQVITGTQYIRVFLITKYVRRKEAASYSIREVVRHIIEPDGQWGTMRRAGAQHYYNYWSLSTDLEFRSTDVLERYIYKEYPRKSIIPELYRNGFTGDLMKYHPRELFRVLLKHSQAETFLKAGDMVMLDRLMKNERRFIRYWPSIRVARRHKFETKDFIMWLDYLDDLRFFKKCLTDPYYICNPNWKKRHTNLTRKRQQILAIRRAETKAKDLIKEEEVYRKEKGRFLNLEFKEGHLRIIPMQSVQQFFEEGTMMGHCIFTNGYYKKENLILSAQVDNCPVETIEVGLNGSVKLLQSRGRSNLDSEYHEQIVKLVQKSIPKIKEVYHG